ncbi:MAG TPA: branched-chain amino acid transaminase [Actinomycetota bacterium]|nr:branched-chain amino acid transaminase [Actinomycetota bacterium]
MPIQPVEKIWMDGKLVPWEDAKVHVLTHALHYGSGVFEGIRAYETSRGLPGIFRLTDHIRRLFRSAAVYMIEIPYSLDELVEAAKDTVRASGLKACYVRPIVYHGYGEMGLNPLYAPVNVAIGVWPWGTYLGDDCLENGARLLISSWRRPDANVLPAQAKATGQYINSGLAKVEAIKAGYDDAIMLSSDGDVAEGTGENLFIVRDGVLVTPPESAGILLGVNRDAAMTIARDMGYEVVERKLLRADLYTADEAFLTGTAAEVTPIREIDGRVLASNGRGPITKEIQQTFFAAVKGDIDRYEPWVEYVE